MARWVVPASWALNPTAEGDQRCPRCLLQLKWRQPPLRLGSRHLVLHLQIASAFSMSKTRHPQKAGGSPLSHHCVNSLEWLIPEHYPICRPCCLCYLLIKLRKSNCGLNLSLTKRVCQSDSCGWTTNSRKTYQNVYVRPQSLYLGTKINWIQ